MSNSKFAAAASVGAGEEIFEEEEDPCMICFDELVPTSTSRLACGHRYHSDVSKNCLIGFDIILLTISFVFGGGRGRGIRGPLYDLLR